MIRMTPSFIMALCALLAQVSSEWTGNIDGASVKVTPYDFGIWRLRKDDGKYEVKDAVVAQPVSTFHERSDDKVHALTHGSVKTVSQSQILLEKSRLNYFEFHVNNNQVSGNHRAAMQVSVNDKDGDKIGASITFPGVQFLYGIPERASDMALKHGHSYRLWNLDVFEYALDDDKGLYGSIPFLMAHGPAGTVGMLWMNAGDTTVSVEILPEGAVAKWTSESGIVDMYVFPGPTPKDVLRQMTYLTGKPQFPPLFSMGYHQCRWNYRNHEDTLNVDEGFDTHNIPYDVLWLDIEHTDGKRYFTWDPNSFHSPVEMQEKIAAKGRKMVTITDPHIKRAQGYHVFDEASAKGYFVKNQANNADYEGNCWPGQSSWVDFTNPDARDWYGTLFGYDKYQGSTPILYNWIDMNEPSVFSGPEVTMEKDVTHYGGVKHKDVHNQYGFYNLWATYNGLLRRSEGPPHDTTTRPFILTRSFFAGSQRYGAVWTGDNMAEWSHLHKATPMLLAMSLSGLTFVGADVGGFFRNPEEELLVRWYQAGAFTPFFRGHAHLETKRREPWLFGEENTNLIRKAIQTRYMILPYIYTTFYTAAKEGLSVISPLFFHWPLDEKLYGLDTQHMLGEAILVKPITNRRSENNDQIEVYLPGSKWFDFKDGTPYTAGTHTIVCDIHKIPVFQKAGSIVPLRERARRSTTAMINDPFTLQIALSAEGFAIGDLYVDDTHSFKYLKGGFTHRQFLYDNGVLTSSAFTNTTLYTEPLTGTGEVFMTETWIERIRIFGFPNKPSQVYLEHETLPGAIDVMAGLDSSHVKARQELSFTHENAILTIRKPMAYVQLDWTITFVQ